MARSRSITCSGRPSCWATSSTAVRENDKGARFVDFTPLPELGELQRAVYLGDGKKFLSEEYLKALTPLALAIWYMDDGSFTVRSKGLQQRTEGGSGRIEICVEAMTEGSRERACAITCATPMALTCACGWPVRRARRCLVFTTAASAKFQEMVAPYMATVDGVQAAAAVPRSVHGVHRSSSSRSAAGAGAGPRCRVKPHTRSMNRFDIEVEGSHNYFADGVMVHNSPETTTGGKALKFYASVRLDVRRIETLKDGTDAVGNRTRVKVVKNKVSPPFKQAEFDILYGKGISKEGSLIDMGVEQGFIRKSGSWFTYDGEQLGQGKENARNFMIENPEVANEIEKKIKEKLGIGAVLTQDATDDGVLPAPVDF